MLMAEIEDGEHGDKGRARQWVARAVRAPRDPMWTADGYASLTWAPVSPATGALGTFEWRVPVEGLAFHGEAEMVAEDDEPEGGDIGEPGHELPAIAVIDVPPAQPEPVPEPEKPAETADAVAAAAIVPKPAPVPAPKPAPVVFVAPPAPDDPGPEAERDLEEVPARFRTPVAE
jgi:HemY protein